MANGDSLNKYWWITLITLAVITALCVAILLKVSEPPPVIEKAGPDLIILDEHWAEWMPLDNGFTYEGNPATWDYWSGFLIQLGRYWERTGSTYNFFPLFGSVEITGDTGEKKLYPGDFVWINIVSVRPGQLPPISPAKAGLLWPDPGTTTECSAIDVCADPYVGSGEPCLCETPPCADVAALELIPPECLRLRSIHSHFRPEAVITYWQGNRGYRLSASHEAHGGEHNRYKFDLIDPVEITYYTSDGAAHPVEVGVIRTIRIKGPDDPDHGHVHDPGLDGGEFGPPPAGP